MTDKSLSNTENQLNVLKESIFNEFSALKNDNNILKDMLVQGVNLILNENKRPPDPILNVKNIINNLIELVNCECSKNAKEILRKNLCQVEIEIFSFCNRQCWFCPNSFIDRHSKNQLMDEDLYLKILSELREINYSNRISYSRYNEPLAHKEIFLKRLRQAKEYCPKSIRHTNTNGDYLTREYFDELAEAGLNSMEIQCYLDEKEIFTPELIIDKIAKLANKFGFKYKVLASVPNEVVITEFDYDKMHVKVASQNFKQRGNTRGDSLKNIRPYNRNEICMIPLKHVYIDYNGSYMLCCNLRSDNPSHKDFILGNANEMSLSDVFMSDKIIEYRKNLNVRGAKIPPCNTCNFLIQDNEILLGRN